jgi:hypothetical protein
VLNFVNLPRIVTLLGLPDPIFGNSEFNWLTWCNIPKNTHPSVFDGFKFQDPLPQNENKNSANNLGPLKMV